MEEEAEGWKERGDTGREGVRVRQGVVAIHPSSTSPRAKGGVKLLTAAWPVVSGGVQVHQGNEIAGFCYGPRCIVGRKEVKLLVDNVKEQKIIHALHFFYSVMLVFIFNVL